MTYEFPLLNIALAILGHLCFHMNLMVILPSSLKNAMDILVKMVLDMLIALENEYEEFSNINFSNTEILEMFMSFSKSFQFGSLAAF